jgi:hypothetical protein
VIVRQSESRQQLLAVRIINIPLRLEFGQAGADPETLFEAAHCRRPAIRRAGSRRRKRRANSTAQVAMPRPRQDGL